MEYYPLSEEDRRKDDSKLAVSITMTYSLPVGFAASLPAAIVLESSSIILAAPGSHFLLFLLLLYPNLLSKQIKQTPPPLTYIYSI